MPVTDTTSGADCVLSIANTYSVLAISISLLAAWWILARGGGTLVL